MIPGIMFLSTAVLLLLAVKIVLRKEGLNSNEKAEAELKEREREWLNEYQKRELSYKNREAHFRQQERLFVSSQIEFEKLQAIQEKRIELAMSGKIKECCELISEERSQKEIWQDSVARWNLFVFNEN
jgi:hypothetical protein